MKLPQSPKAVPIRAGKPMAEVARNRNWRMHQTRCRGADSPRTMYENAAILLAMREGLISRKDANGAINTKSAVLLSAETAIFGRDLAHYLRRNE